MDYYGNPKQLCRKIMFQHLSSSEICEHDLKMTLPDKLEVYQNTVSCDLDKGYMKKLHQKNYLQ